MRSRSRSRRKNRALRPRAHQHRAQPTVDTSASLETPSTETPSTETPLTHTLTVEGDAPAERVTRPEIASARAQREIPETEAEAPPEAPEREDVLAEEDSGPSSLSLSSEFFRDRGDSFPPLVEDAIDDDEEEPPSAELVARRSRLRRAVGGFVGAVAAACAVAIALGGSSPSPLAQAANAAPPMVELDEAPAQPETEPEPETELEPEPEPEPETETETETETEDELDEEPAAIDEDADPATLRRDALRLLNQGKYDEAIAAADAAIAADPEDALPYLCKGSALSDRGDRAGAVEAYSACLRHAKRGAVYECSALGGRK